MKKSKQYTDFFRSSPKHRRATIICTIGPASENPEMIDKFIEVGMDVARLNFSHGDHVQKGAIIKMVRAAEAKAGRPIAILQDLQGPKLRVGELQGGKTIHLKTDEEVTITTDPCFGTAERFFVDYKSLSLDVAPGDPILLADGTITLKVISSDPKEGEVKCKIIHGGPLSPRKGVNLPGIKLSIAALTDKDKVDLDFGVKSCVDWVALSFVREAQDIISLRERIARIIEQSDLPNDTVPPKIIAKIEKPEAVNNIEEILEAADGIMVARGDLGVEMKNVIVPVIQKEIINLANILGKPVVTATQMLESMIEAPIPTRAEVSDVANAIFDGSDGIMLSAESAAGKFPSESVAYLDRIARESEASPIFSPRIQESRADLSDAIAASSCDLAKSIDAACIAVFTHTGKTATQIARYRPMTPIIALCTNQTVSRQLMMNWNIKPVMVPVCHEHEELIEVAEESVMKLGCGKKDDEFVLVAGSSTKPGRTDWVRACILSENK